MVLGRRGRVMFTPHGWSFWAVSGAASRVVVSLERLCALGCQTIVAVSDFERDAGLRAGAGRRYQYLVVPNSVDLDRFAGAPDPVAGRIVMVARLAEPRRHDLVIDALAKLRAVHPEATVVFAGDGPKRAALEAQVDALGLGDAVTFLGDRSDISEQLAAAAVVAQATRYEGCSLAVLEAMAAGRPVVASRVGGMDEIVREGETGQLCDDDAVAWADALARYLGDPLGAEAAGAAARRRARARHGRDRAARTTLEAYRALNLSRK